MKNRLMDGRWYQRAVFYELRVRSFADGNGDGVGDFKGLIARLGYLKRLGVDCLWMLPIHPSPLKDDGYDVADYYSVHPDYGTFADFKAFLREAHRLGLKVILDLVLNHTSDRCAWFQESRRLGSPKRDWYVWSSTKARYRGVPVIFEDYEDSNWTWDRAAGAYYWHRFFRSQPDLNFDNPEVREEMLKVAEFWLRMGVDGFRLDAVPYLFEKEGTRCQHLLKTHAYLKSLRRLVDERYPGRLLLAEAGGRPKEIFQYFGWPPGDECHMAFHFPLAAELLLALADGNGALVQRAFRSLPQPPKECAWGLFLRNHDGVNLSFLTPSERKRVVKAYAPEPGMLLHDEPRRRLSPMLGGDGRKLRLLHALLLSLPGSPVLYYGDELGMGEDLSLPDRFGLRTPMTWPDARRQEKDPDSMLSWLKRALAVRRVHPAFARGSLEFLPCRDRGILGFRRALRDREVRVMANLTGERKFIPWRPGRAVWRALWGESCFPREGRLILPPYGFIWASLP